MEPADVAAYRTSIRFDPYLKTMTPERSQEIDSIFAAALELEPQKRGRFLIEACAGDEQLRKEVESLLVHDSAGTFTHHGAVEEATRILRTSEASSLANRNIGPYKIIRVVGSGGMGQVYLGHDMRLNRPVAVKLLSFYDAAQRERIGRFRQEALAASALNHPNILTIYEIGELEGHNFIVTEFVEGQTLLSRIQQGPVDLELAVDIASQIAGALAAAHAAGIVHRDIKPANIMLRPDGLVKVLDFGIAKSLRPENPQLPETAIQTAPGSVVGTAAYMSPEQARAASVDARTDIWSLGVILFEMVTSRRPFEGETPMDVLSSVIERDPPTFSQLGIKVPGSFQQIVRRSLEKDRELRYSNANELANALKALKKSVESGTELDSEILNSSGNQRAIKVITATAGGEIENKESREGAQVARTTRQQILSTRTVLVALLLLLSIGIAAFTYWSRKGSLAAKSIAVLPFKNESGNSDLEYLSDGMTDSLINSLSQLPQVTVKAHNSVFRYKNRELDPQRIASELSVEAILNGRVVQRGDDLTVYLWLVDARDGNQVWGEQYNRKASDLLALQREIALDVSEKLRVRLSGTAAQRVTKDYTANTEAYRLYLRGRFHLQKITLPEVQQGITHFQKAIDLDPNYALAYAGLSGAYRALALGSELPPRENLSRAKAAAQKALELDGQLSEAHSAFGGCNFWFDRNWTKAENHYRRALELNPNEAEAHLFYAHLLSNTGRHEEALVEIARAKDLDPLSPFISSLEGQFLVHASKPDEALVKLKDTFTLAPDFWFPHLFAASAYIEKGMFAEAVGESRRATELSGFQTISVAFEGYALAKMGRRDEARAILEKLLKLSQARFVPPYHVALVYNALGEREQTLLWLERALEIGDAKLVFLKVEPKWNNLRTDEKFNDLMRRVGF